jgi:diacylglycerol kinase (ATP)
MLILLFTISLVLVTEMINSAIEALVDMVTQQYSPQAKFAKDIAAGAVLIATMNAIIVGAILFLRQRNLELLAIKLNRKPDAGWTTTTLIVCGVIIFITMVIGKVLGGRGTIWKGGLISGHSAVGFFLAFTIIVISPTFLTAILAVILAALIAQSRVEAGIHSLQEVTFGAVLGILIAGLMYFFTSPGPITR